MSYSKSLERARAAALEAGADDVEVSYAGTTLHFWRFASSRFTQSGAITNHVVRVRVLVDRHLGVCSAASLAPSDLTGAARAAVTAARTAPGGEQSLAFGTADDNPTATATAELPPIPDQFTPADAPASLARAFSIAAGDDALCAGSLKITRRVAAVRTAAGLHVDGADGTVDAQLIALNDDASGFAGAATPLGDADQIDLQALAAAATAKASRGRNPITLEPGAYDVVLGPEAVADLLESMAIASFGARSVLDGSGLLAGRTGEQLCSPAITVIDQAPATGITFDAEGTPRRTVHLLNRGIAGSPVTDRVTATQLGAQLTGHAPPVDYADDDGPITSRLRLEPGPHTEADLIARIDRGVYVTRLHYVNGRIDTRQATTTGMTRDGAFIIENGRLGRGIRNLRFTDSLLDCWGKRLIGVGGERRGAVSWWGSGGMVLVPAMAIRRFRFTGQSR